jgi:hypothetical protein
VKKVPRSKQMICSKRCASTVNEDQSQSPLISVEAYHSTQRHHFEGPFFSYITSEDPVKGDGVWRAATNMKCFPPADLMPVAIR